MDNLSFVDGDDDGGGSDGFLVVGGDDGSSGEPLPRSTIPMIRIILVSVILCSLKSRMRLRKASLRPFTRHDYLVSPSLIRRFYIKKIAFDCPTLGPSVSTR